MATLREYIYDVKMLAHKNKISDDSRLTDRMIAFWINSQRAMWLQRQQNRSHRNDPQIIQSLGAVPVDIVDASEAPDSLKTGYSILRTTRKIPKTVFLDDLDDGITSVGSIDRMKYRYSYIPYKRAFFAGNCRYNSDEIFAFRQNNQDESYLYLFSGKDNQDFEALEYVSIRGIFEDPRDLADYADLDGVKKYTKNSDYPINRSMWEFLKQQIIQTNFQALAEMPTDTTNDAADEKIDV